MQVNGGPRLACKVFPRGGEQVALPETASGVILGDTLPPPPCQPGRTGLSAAVDLGTTTVVVKLYDRTHGAELAAQRATKSDLDYIRECLEANQRHHRTDNIIQNYRIKLIPRLKASNLTKEGSASLRSQIKNLLNRKRF